MRRRGSRIPIISVFLLFIILLGLIYFAWNTATDIFQPVSAASGGKTLTIVVQDGETVAQLADDLQAKGLIRNALAFRIWAKIKGLDTRLQAGVYGNLSPGMTVSDLVDQFMTGQPDQVVARVPEGWRLEQIADKLAGAGLPKFDKQTFLNYTKKPTTFLDAAKFPLLKQIPQGGTMEGLLFPDTYFFSIGATTTDVIDAMLKEMSDKITQNHHDVQAKANKLNVYQMLTLASIVERETSFDADRGGIASVYWNRIYRPNAETVGRLQSDPTVEYARDTENPPAKYWQQLNDVGGNIAPNSPWNTYTHNSWPLTPICSPSFASMKAAANPAKTDYYFFLGRPDNGRAVFAKTQAEFNQDVQKYLKQ